MKDIGGLMQEQLGLIKKLNERQSGMQFALLALAGGADNPQKLIQSLETVKAMVSPGGNPSQEQIRDAILSQLDMLIQHVRDSNPESFREGD